MRAEGAVTSVAADGSAAVLACQTNRPDAVVLDMMLPKASGFVVMEKIREMPQPPVVVMVTANLGKRHQVYAQDLGVHAYLNKPVSLQRLVATLVKLLEQRDNPGKAPKSAPVAKDAAPATPGPDASRDGGSRGPSGR